MRTRLAVLYGGRSGEHEVSRKSAEAILAHLDRDIYQVTEVLIERDGGWRVDGRATTLSGALGALRSQDLVFPALHGPYGEDGTVQSMLDWLGVPYVGNGVFASAAGMDKTVTKRLLAAAGLRVATGVTLRPGEELSPADRRRLGLPAFVKPARAGSSIGVGRVEDWSGLPGALRRAREADGKVLVERAVRGREIDVAVLEHPDGRVEAGPPLEIDVTGTFFDYGAKYDGGAVFHVPAPLDAATARLLRDRAVRAFHALDCRGLLRVDFFLPEPDPAAEHEHGSGSGSVSAPEPASEPASPGAAGSWRGDPGEPVVNEVNTFPGFTSASQYPLVWQRAGIAFPRLLDILVETARRRADGDRARLAVDRTGTRRQGPHGQ